jgi:hypothetical protein
VQVYRFQAPPGGKGLLGYLWEYGYAMAMTFILTLLVFIREGFDVIHAHNPPDTFVFIAAAYKLLGKRFVFDHHDLSPELFYARFGDEGNRLGNAGKTLVPVGRSRYCHEPILQDDCYGTWAGAGGTYHYCA